MSGFGLQALMKVFQDGDVDLMEPSLVRSREWVYWDYYRGPSGTLIGIHSPIPYPKP